MKSFKTGSRVSLGAAYNEHAGKPGTVTGFSLWGNSDQEVIDGIERAGTQRLRVQMDDKSMPFCGDVAANALDCDLLPEPPQAA